MWSLQNFQLKDIRNTWRRRNKIKMGSGIQKLIWWVHRHTNSMEVA
jgi:hypothetical protein